MLEQDNQSITISCGPQAKEELQKLMGEESFPSSETIIEGILSIVNQVSDYHEEGVRLFPEVIIVNDISILKMIQARTEQVYDGAIEEHTFSRIMKLCAPLANSNWSIYVNIVDNEHVQYGVVSGELKETSLSLRRQVLEITPKVNHVLYIRNIGSKNVEIRNTFRTSIVSLTLDGSIINQDDNLNSLIACTIADVPDDLKSVILFDFMHKTIGDALDEGHGNLIAVCKENDLSVCLEEMSGGSVIDKPIDIPSLLNDDRMFEKNTTSVAIKSYVSLIKSMINHDGITFVSTTGKILAYHYIVNNNKVESVQVVGGSRTKAFEALKNVSGIYACFLKSQDGLTKFHCNG